MDSLIKNLADKKRELDREIKKLPISAQAEINVFTQKLENINNNSTLSIEEKRTELQENLTKFKARYGAESNK
jgi:hypothetical protein